MKMIKWIIKKIELWFLYCDLQTCDENMWFCSDYNYEDWKKDTEAIQSRIDKIKP